MSKSGFCWADEVEKEEEESRTHLHEPKKPNPFGSARPREVVLQEKGIDWRKIDQKLHQQPSIPRKENQVKDNASEPLGCLEIEDEDTDSNVPPLRYPPKNIMSLLKENQWPNIISRVHPSLSKSAEFQAKPMKPKGMIEKENYAHEELGEKRKFRSSSVCGEREWGNMKPEYRVLGTERRRGAADIYVENIENGYRRGNGVRERGTVGGYRYMHKEARDVGVRPLEECESMEFMYGRQRIDPRKVEGIHSGRVDGRREQAHQEVGMGGFGFNKRRGIEMGPNNSRDHQRRRK